MLNQLIAHRRKNMIYNYCPMCGRKLHMIEVGDDGMMPKCDDCNKVWFDTFDCSVAVLTYNEFNEIVLQMEDFYSKKYGIFTYGHIVTGETPEQAAVREVKEEIGQDIEKITYVGSYWTRNKETLLHCFLGFTHKAPITVSKEIRSAEWVPVLNAPERMYPENPTNTMYPLYRKLLELLDIPDPTDTPIEERAFYNK